MSMTMNDVHDMLDEMGFCPNCGEHTPCGCEAVVECETCGAENTADELELNDHKCYNCNSLME